MLVFSLGCKKTERNTEKNLIEVTRVDFNPAYTSKITVDKSNYKIIQHLDSLHSQAYYVEFRTNDLGKITNILIRTRFKKNLSKDKNLMRWEEFYHNLFYAKNNLANLSELKALRLYLTHFNEPIRLNIPESFNNLEILQVLYASIEGIHFHPESKVKALFLNYNQITSLDSVTNNLKELNTLHIRYNKIKKVLIDTVRFKSLKDLDLTGNPLEVEINVLRRKYPSITIYYHIDGKLTLPTQ